MSSSLSLLPFQQFAGAVSSRKRQIRGPERSKCDKKRGSYLNIARWSEISNHRLHNAKKGKSVVKAGWVFNYFSMMTQHFHAYISLVYSKFEESLPKSPDP